MLLTFMTNPNGTYAVYKILAAPGPAWGPACLPEQLVGASSSSSFQCSLTCPVLEEPHPLRGDESMPTDTRCRSCFHLFFTTLATVVITNRKSGKKKKSSHPFISSAYQSSCPIVGIKLIFVG